MKLSDVHSQELLPRFAKDYAFIMNALDSVIKSTAYRTKAIDSPLTMEAIQACTDEELQALYDQYGVAQYYPDLSRSTRDKMLYEMCKIYRYLGTPKAVELLCDYIFDSLPLDLKVWDNLAFNDAGDLIDASLLDVFDVSIEPTAPVLDEDTNARILANIIRFSRNSQYLRDILYDFSETFTVPIRWCVNADNPQVTQTWDQESLCIGAAKLALCGYIDSVSDVKITVDYPERLQNGSVFFYGGTLRNNGILQSGVVEADI